MTTQSGPEQPGLQHRARVHVGGFQPEPAGTGVVLRGPDAIRPADQSARAEAVLLGQSEPLRARSTRVEKRFARPGFLGRGTGDGGLSHAHVVVLTLEPAGRRARRAHRGRLQRQRASALERDVHGEHPARDRLDVLHRRAAGRARHRASEVTPHHSGRVDEDAGPPSLRKPGAHQGAGRSGSHARRVHRQPLARKPRSTAAASPS